jgi:hypothetical protein
VSVVVRNRQNGPVFLREEIALSHREVVGRWKRLTRLEPRPTTKIAAELASSGVLRCVGTYGQNRQTSLAFSLSGIPFHVSHKFLSTFNVSCTVEDLLHQIGRAIPWIVILYPSQPA